MENHSFILLGQSNMAGRGDFGEVPEIHHLRILMLRNGCWIIMTEPVTTDRGIFGSWHSGISLAPSFALDYAEDHPDVNVCLVPCADGGTSLYTDWLPGSKLFDHAVAITKLAARSSQIKGILFHQGESDASDPKSIAAYRANFEKFITAFFFEAELSPETPVIIGELSKCEGPYAAQNARINQILHEIAESKDTCAVVSSDGLELKSDGIHFNSMSLREFGHRYYQAYCTVPELKYSDDTQEIQSMLDNSQPLVFLNKAHYWVSKPLKIRNNQTILLGDQSIIHLLPQSNCFMLEARNCSNISIRGGCWDFANYNQRPNPFCVPSSPDEKFKTPDCKEYTETYYGPAMLFDRVKNLEISNLTFRNTTTFAIQMARTEDFLVDNVFFDNNLGNPFAINSDGLHLDGFCHRGTIRNLSGVVHDDAVALNADDFIHGPISDIVVEGIHVKNSRRLIRLLTNKSMISNIVLRNIAGTFYQNAIMISNWNHDGSTAGLLKNIRIENLQANHIPKIPQYFSGKTQFYCQIHIFGKLAVQNLQVVGFKTDESITDLPCVFIGAEVKIDYFLLKDCRKLHLRPTEGVFLQNESMIEELHIENIELQNCRLQENGQVIGFT